LLPQIIFGDRHRSISSSLRSFLHSPDTSSPPQHPILELYQTVFAPQCDRPSFTLMQNNGQNYRTFHKDSRHIVSFERNETLSCDYNGKLHYRPFPFTVLCLVTEPSELSTVGKCRRKWQNG
jgi:hypothetical protein